MTKTRILMLLAALMPGIGLTDNESVPAWYLEEIATLTDGSGRWIADNMAYKSEQEPFDAYATEWKSSFGGTTLTGRLFGMRGGDETVDFWEFRQYWHPGRQEVVIEQFGWGGAVGIGIAWRDGERVKSDQTFFQGDGSKKRSGHISYFPDANTHDTKSFDIDGETWKPNREYVWRRELAPPDFEEQPVDEQPIQIQRSAAD